MLYECFQSRFKIISHRTQAVVFEGPDKRKQQKVEISAHQTLGALSR